MSAVPRARNEIVVFRRKATLESRKARMVFFACLRGQVEWQDNLLKILKKGMQHATWRHLLQNHIDQKTATLEVVLVHSIRTFLQ